MKKIIIYIILMLMLSVLASAQQTTSETSVIINSITKESFLTRSEIKKYMDDKSIEYNENAMNMINKGINDFEQIINDKVNLIILKFMLGIFGIVFFSQTLWYFFKLKLDKRKQNIMNLKRSIVEKGENTPEEEKTPQKAEKTPIKAKETRKEKKKRLKTANKEYNEFQEFKRWKQENDGK